MLLTKSELTKKLQELGLASGQTVMVHSSLSAFGYVLGGAQTIVRTLLDILGEQGTLVMPAFSPQISDPAGWQNVNLNDDDLAKARSEVPLFDQRITPTTMGHIPEVFRNWPGTKRSAHPQVSICAKGLHADKIIHPHNLEWGEGRRSPFERLYELEAFVLILGVGFNRITLLHYAESLVANGRRKTRKIPQLDGQNLVWREVVDVGDDLDTHFPIIGRQFMKKGRVSQVKIGAASCGLMPVKELVDFSVNYFEKIFTRPER